MRLHLNKGHEQPHTAVAAANATVESVIARTHRHTATQPHSHTATQPHAHRPTRSKRRRVTPKRSGVAANTPCWVAAAVSWRSEEPVEGNPRSEGSSTTAVGGGGVCGRSSFRLPTSAATHLASSAMTTFFVRTALSTSWCCAMRRRQVDRCLRWGCHTITQRWRCERLDVRMARRTTTATATTTAT